MNGKSFNVSLSRDVRSLPSSKTSVIRCGQSFSGHMVRDERVVRLRYVTEIIWPWSLRESRAGTKRTSQEGGPEGRNPPGKKATENCCRFTMFLRPPNSSRVLYCRAPILWSCVVSGIFLLFSFKTLYPGPRPTFQQRRTPAWLKIRQKWCQRSPVLRYDTKGV